MRVVTHASSHAGAVGAGRFVTFDRAHGPHRQARRVTHHVTSVEAHTRVADHQRIVEEPLIRQSIRHHEQVIVGDDRMSTERELTRCL